MLVRWLRPECVSAARRDRYSDFMLNPPARLPVRGVLRCCVRLSDAVRIKHGGCAVQASRAKPRHKTVSETPAGDRTGPPSGACPRRRAPGREPRVLSLVGAASCARRCGRGASEATSHQTAETSYKLDDGLREFRVRWSALAVIVNPPRFRAVPERSRSAKDTFEALRVFLTRFSPHDTACRSLL